MKKLIIGLIAAMAITFVACGKIKIPACITDGSCLPSFPTAAPTTATEAPRASVSPTATATASPTSTARPLPSAITVAKSDCVKNSVAGKLTGYVSAAQEKYKQDHIGLFDGDVLVDPAEWDGFYFGVVENLNTQKTPKLLAAVDNCGGNGICGEIVVKYAFVKPGEGVHEYYHVLISSGEIRRSAGIYLGTCKPSGF